MSLPEADIPNPEFFYDLGEGRLLAGSQAYLDAIESGGDARDISPLSDVLVDEDLRSDKQPALDVCNWSRDDYISFGKWLLGRVPARLTLKHLERAYVLGIGPEPQRIYRKDKRTSQIRFKGYAQFYREIGAEGSIKRGEYDGWSFSDCFSFVKTHADRLAKSGVRPTVLYFKALSEKGDAPAVSTISRISGNTYGALLDMADYPQPKSWDEDDFIKWGVKFCIANDGRLPFYGGLSELSKKFRGPSHGSVHRRFGGIIAFQNAVLQAYEEHLKLKADHQQTMFDKIQLEIESGILPGALIVGSDEDDVLTSVAKFWLARKLLPDVDTPELMRITSIKSFERYMAAVKRISGATDGQLETAAVALGVFDELWPFDDYKFNLRLVG